MKNFLFRFYEWDHDLSAKPHELIVLFALFCTIEFIFSIIYWMTCGFTLNPIIFLILGIFSSISVFCIMYIIASLSEYYYKKEKKLISKEIKFEKN